ncbi:hypothetical protein EYF80_026610 [Liparis tanakae]|uniref:Uncharacterized protein n=1 Tax=Liparis tanakae TaxID=230148 RepID=A0A4Z2HBK8_9TELE|nr:hypothetical protein EYF80_026610 [Liparis tanakae]
MGDDCNSGVIQVEPGGNLPVGDDEDVPHPGGVSLHGAQRIAQLLVVLKTAGRHVFVLFGLEGNNGQILLGLLRQVGEVLRGVQVQQGDAGLGNRPGNTRKPLETTSTETVVAGWKALFIGSSSLAAEKEEESAGSSLRVTLAGRAGSRASMGAMIQWDSRHSGLTLRRRRR